MYVGLALLAFFAIRTWNLAHQPANPYLPTLDQLQAAANAAPTVVQYQVWGPQNEADFTYNTPSGIEQSHGYLPLTDRTMGRGVTFKGFSPGDPVSVSAQLSGTGKITCQITIDGKVIATNTSSGEFAVVTCAGVV
jgi:hypothetical protein